MNKSESKYFNTAIKMDEAFLSLLEKKDFEYITVKEICEKAKVNRSTFYLHYETIGDLLAESIEHINNHFLNYMKHSSTEFISKIKDCPKSELYLVTPQYLTPYLSYIKEHKRLFLTSLNNVAILQLNKAYNQMFKYVLSPILERFQILEKEREYIASFYIDGLMAIIKKWLENDCTDSIEDIIKIMQKCVKKID